MDRQLYLGIADDVLRDLYVRGKYRDVILPMTVLRRLDAVLGPSKPAVVETKKWLDRLGITSQDGPHGDYACASARHQSTTRLQRARRNERINQEYGKLGSDNESFRRWLADTVFR